MLTKTEQRFVQNPEVFSRNQVWLHRCRINKKIKKFVSDLHIIIEKNDELGLNLKPLDELFETRKRFQNSERSDKKTTSDPVDTNDSILHKFENW
jgi:hypothetical protein